MARIIALAVVPETSPLLEALRGAIVCVCACALIAAGRTLPF